MKMFKHDKNTFSLTMIRSDFDVTQAKPTMQLVPEKKFYYAEKKLPVAYYSYTRNLLQNITHTGHNIA